MPGTMLSLDEGCPFEFIDGEPTHIRIGPFFRLVREFWKQFDRGMIAANWDPLGFPKSGLSITPSALSIAPIAPSDCSVAKLPQRSRRG